ncbi:DUF1080 domain-containing protein [Gracilimonas sp.]|uniref:3-keto-disaccharide hydrolase n=1 Tax=Gracilimonas sp. TaxID=1974203 RepID=UPI0032ED6B75
MQHNLLLSILVFFLAYSGCNDEKVSPPKQSYFQSILTDSTLNEWSGKSGYWTFEDGVLTGEITPNNILLENTFFIWNGEISENFELKAEFRISGKGNSGINYRSSLVEGKDFALKGYQADFNGSHEFTGNIYDEKGRGTLAKRGQIVYVPSTNSATNIVRTGTGEALFSKIDTTKNGWNEYHIIANGNTVIHLVNGHIMSTLIDESDSRIIGKKLGLQLHLGPPMKVEFRNIQLKKL